MHGSHSKIVVDGRQNQEDPESQRGAGDGKTKSMGQEVVEGEWCGDGKRQSEWRHTRDAMPWETDWPGEDRCEWVRNGGRRDRLTRIEE